MDAADFAAAHGGSDVLVVRRVRPGRWAHLGGHGRGAGWAGIVDIGEDGEPHFTAALRSRTVVRHRAAEPQRVLGPYYARQFALVPVDADNLVVLGQAGAEPAVDPDDEALRRDAHALVDQLGDVSPAKRLADEMEVLQAMQDIYQVGGGSYQDALDGVADVARRALSCEVALLITAEGRVAVSLAGPPTGAPDAGPHRLDGVRLARLAVGLLPELLRRTAGGPRCVQDAVEDPLPAPLAPAEGVRSYYVLPVPEPIGGVLLVCHTDLAPRGFTSLCQQLGRQLVTAAVAVLHAAGLREQLQAEVDSATMAARLDPLTGLGNRLAWDLAVAAAEAAAGRGQPVSVLVLDLNWLKQTNDTYGHAVGDDLLRRLGRCVRTAVRSADTVCRVGGDEVYVLLAGADAATGAEVGRRIRAAVAADCGGSTGRSGAAPRLSVALGGATVTPGGTVADAIHRADRAMYVDKTRQHAAAEPAAAPEPAG